MTATHPTVSVEIDFTTDLAGGVGYHEQVAPSGPYAYYRLKETSGTFADASGNGHTGTGAGTIDYNETAGNPVSGDATARYVLFTTDTTRIGLTGVVPQTGQFTAEAFIYVTSLAVDRYIFENDGTFAAGSYLEFWVETTGALSARAGNSATIVSSSAGDIVTGGFYHVGVVFDAPARTISLVKNGALLVTDDWETSGRSSTSLSKLNTSWHWGTDSSASKGSVARIAEPAVYTRALALSEFADHYAARLVTPFAGYTFTDVTPDVLWGDGLRRSFGRASELDDVVAMQTEFVLRSDDRTYEVEYGPSYANMIINPSFEVNTNIWEAANVGTTLTRVTSWAQFGTASCQLACTGAFSGQGIRTTAAASPAASPGEVWTGSIYAQGTGTVKIFLDALDGGGATLSSFQGGNIVLSSSPERISLTTGALPASTVQIRLKLATTSAQAVTFYVDAAEFLETADLSDYSDGDQSGSFWEAGAHSSATVHGSPYFPNVVPGRPCRVTMTQDAVTYDWAFGFIEDWPQNWDRAGMFCRVPIRATCFLERLNEEDIGARDFPEQAAGSRLTTLLNAAGHPTSMRDIDAGAETLMALVSDTNTVGAHARAIARTDRGLFFFAPDGDGTFQDGDHRGSATRSTVSNGTIGPGGIPYFSPAFHLPRERVRNYITLRRPGGVDQTVTDQQSRLTNGIRSFSDEILLTTDALVATRAATLLAAYKDPHRRIQAITFNPATQPGYWEHALGVLPSDLYEWIFQPAQGSSVTTDVFVEGVVDEYRNKEYVSKWFLSVVP